MKHPLFMVRFTQSLMSNIHTLSIREYVYPYCLPTLIAFDRLIRFDQGKHDQQQGTDVTKNLYIG